MFVRTHDACQRHRVQVGDGGKCQDMFAAVEFDESMEWT